MAQFTTLTSHAVPLPAENVDTDQIIPARFLKVTDKNGLGDSLFCDWRYLEDGSDNPEFVLNEAASQGAQILIAGNNFGSGSSREHAPWALVGWGFRAIISTGFADIFKSNSLKNGLLPVEVSSDVYKALLEAVQLDRSTKITIDLPTQSVTGLDGLEATFPIDAFSKHCLLEGLDQLAYLLSFDGQITNYEQERT
ncbi:MAG: 3-isopropylmalate dehydratase small subunit [Deltaproteobacteria bacterium]|nr:3-isopropylmalate dehydratase small subunit [Deltaproteobacteria bacterium]MBW1874896.1 3-isopropylmalate dehydratase small subunit [Deltaproteobacteria bacterium]MBW2211641.1 3-isopropylmalate dehydratase small subunit [Deltaproteobacteria bacterium]MBW2213574.1 3-isopropylmalate dehydratase small subunit [Deltaproteobacteria bacterium]MBW2378661.1 3-isopropylmalate dehydratase small subunit [Deltaproteobacteria bacterium]